MQILHFGGASYFTPIFDITLALLYKLYHIGSMTTNNNEHLKTLFQKILPGTVMLAGSLIKLGISRDLQQYYKKSGWIKSIGSGAFIRAHDKTEWDGGIYALQNQEKLNIYPGGLTALTLQGFSH